MQALFQRLLGADIDKGDDHTVDPVDLSTLPSTELLMPINRVLFPAFVQVRQRPDELKRVFLLAQSVQSLVAIPASAGLALTAPQLVAVLLGPQWAMAVKPLPT